MMLTSDNLPAFRSLLAEIKREARSRCGDAHKPLHVLQLTHSGRYSRPFGHQARPLIPQHDPILDSRSGLATDAPVVSDMYLDELIPRYVQSARLAQEAGFDGVDIKACHRYLLSELLASHTREGRYGGSLANRSRLLLDIVRAIRQELGSEFILACRFNVFDAHPYPYGFGCAQDDMWRFDPTEPMELVRLLTGAGVNLLSNSAGNPYYIYPQVTRPFDQSSMGIPVPEEHPLTSVARLFSFTQAVQEAASSVPVVGNGYTWLRHFAPLAGAANLADGRCGMVGFGRQAFAYPDAPADILNLGRMEPGQCCTTCSKCTQIMRDHGTTGCVVRDAQVYAPLYKSFREAAAAREWAAQK